jgi:arabinan endo-1,5-alpha-L-arabinosidase
VRRLLWIATLVILSVPFLRAAHSQEAHAFQLSGDYAGTHDPSIAREGDNYYVFATGRAPGGGQFAIRCSHDLTEWKLCGHVFDSFPEWIHKTSPRTKELWAPDISFFNGEYHLYYAYFNAIDPNIVLDRKGQPWMSFGSFWSGIKMRRIDLATGKPAEKDATLYSLARRSRPEHEEPAKSGLPSDWQAIEAPFIVRHGGFYYLFVSFDLCCRGTHSTYRTMVGRSHKVTGPYVDREGRKLLMGGGSQLLTANSRWLGPGGESVLQRPEGDLIVFHAYDAATGKPALQISTLAWKSGWPEAALATVGEAK